MEVDDPLLAYRMAELACAESWFTMRRSGGNRLLEIGAGTGHQAQQLAMHGYSVEAIDLQNSPYRDAKVFPVTQYDGVHLPFASECFDIVYSSNVLEHVEHLRLLLTEVNRVLKPGGISVHIMPTPAWRLWSLLTHFPWVIKRGLAIVSGRRQLAKRELGRVATTAPTSIVQAFASAIPRRHGYHGTLLGELWSYRANRWRTEFDQAGLQPCGDAAAGLFYTGPQLLGAMLELRHRRTLSKMLGSAVRIYCFRKPLPNV